MRTAINIKLVLLAFTDNLFALNQLQISQLMLIILVAYQDVSPNASEYHLQTK